MCSHQQNPFLEDFCVILFVWNLNMRFIGHDDSKIQNTVLSACIWERILQNIGRSCRNRAEILKLDFFFFYLLIYQRFTCIFLFKARNTFVSVYQKCCWAASFLSCKISAIKLSPIELWRSDVPVWEGEMQSVCSLCYCSLNSTLVEKSFICLHRRRWPFIFVIKSNIWAPVLLYKRDFLETNKQREPLHPVRSTVFASRISIFSNQASVQDFSQ